MRDELLALARYGAFVGLIIICLGGGLLWLLAPDASYSHVERRRSPIPQKILDSIAGGERLVEAARPEARLAAAQPRMAAHRPERAAEQVLA